MNSLTASEILDRTGTKNNFENLGAISDHTVPGSLIGDGQFKVILC